MVAGNSYTIILIIAFVVVFFWVLALGKMIYMIIAGLRKDK